MCEALEQSLGLHFSDKILLQLALTHSTYASQKGMPVTESNERLEFLGDSVLACITADFLYRAFPELSEGDLSDLRAALVKGETLARFAQDIALGEHLIIGRGESPRALGRRVLASAFEALLGAIYLDQGLEAARAFILPRIEPLARHIVENRLFKDHKSLFQELAQAREGITPVYRLVRQEGPSHNREFTVEVMLGETVAGRGHGRNKQAAEQEAALVALRKRGWL